MKAQKRHAAAPELTTLDLFAPASALPSASMPMPSPVRLPIPVPLRESELASPAPRFHARAKPLWYAVIFPQLIADPQAATLLQRLSLSALQFTSFVSIELPNALLLEIRGSVTLFGTLNALQTDIDALWHRLELQAQSATTPSTVASLWCARAGKSVLIEEASLLAGCVADLPLSCTAWNPHWLQTLRSMGVTRVAELSRLPRAGISRRLSPTAMADLDVAFGKQAAPRRAFVPCERFRERCDFETEVDTVGYLQKAIEPLIERCADFLRERQSGIQALELTLRHRAAPLTRIRLGLATITSERRRLADVIDQKLERLELVASVRGMVLSSGSLLPLSASSLDAFGGARSGMRSGARSGVRSGGRDTAPQLVERLRARLGEAAVYGVVVIPEHRPEAAWQRVHELRLTSVLRVAKPKSAQTASDHDLLRPVWLLDAPAPLSESELVLEQGPERIESGWWDGKGVARDYYIARQACGARCWVFQERHSRSWYLHGIFA